MSILAFHLTFKATLALEVFNLREAALRYSGGDVIVLCGLVAIGFSLPLFLKNAGGILHVVSTYIIPVAVAGLAVAYEPRRGDAKYPETVAVSGFKDWNLKGPTVAIKNTAPELH